jgi:hypothetical protein
MSSWTPDLLSICLIVLTGCALVAVRELLQITRYARRILEMANQWTHGSGAIIAAEYVARAMDRRSPLPSEADERDRGAR